MELQLELQLELELEFLLWPTVSPEIMDGFFYLSLLFLNALIMPVKITYHYEDPQRNSVARDTRCMGTKKHSCVISWYQARPQSKFPTRPTASKPYIARSNCAYVIEQ
jgi:hypothetical protein